MKLGGERLELTRVSQSVCKLNLVVNPSSEAWGPFIAPQGNLAVECQKARHVRVGAGHVRQLSLEPS
jgi:hypothetical protein